MREERIEIMTAKFDQSPIRSIGPNASEINVGALSNLQVRRLLHAAASLCTKFASQFFPEEQVIFLEGDFVINLESRTEHALEIYLERAASKPLVNASTAAAALFLKLVIHGADDLFNQDQDHDPLLRESQKSLVHEFAIYYIAANSGQSLKNPCIIHLPHGDKAIDIAVQGNIAKAPEIENLTRRYAGIAELDAASHSQAMIALRLIKDDMEGNKILKIRANNVGELKTAFFIAQTDHRQAYVRLHQVRDGQHKLHWHLDEIVPAAEHKHSELSLVN